MFLDKWTLENLYESPMNKYIIIINTFLLNIIIIIVVIIIMAQISPLLFPLRNTLNLLSPPVIH